MGNISNTTTIHHLIPISSSIDGDDNTFFQGFSKEVISKHFWIFSILPSFPFDIAEMFLLDDERALVRMCGTSQNVSILQEHLFLEYNVYKENAFVVIWCNEDTIDTVLKFANQLKYKPILISSFDHELTINFLELSPIAIKEIFKNKIDEYISFEPESEISKYLNDLKCKETEQNTIESSLDEERHNINLPNLHILNNYGYKFHDSVPFVGKTVDDHVSSMLKYVYEIDSIRNKINVDTRYRKSDAIIYCPSLYQFLYDMKSDFWKSLNRKLGKPQRDFIKNVLVKIKGYSSYATESDSLIQALEDPYVKVLFKERKDELDFQTTLITIYATGHFCPAIRLPHAVMLNSNLINIMSSLATNKSNSSSRKLMKIYIKYDSALKNILDNELLDACFKNRSQLKFVCDFPIEWLRYNKIPLMFSHKVSRICSTPGNLLTSSILFGARISFNQNSLNNILVIRSFSNKDPIKHQLEEALNLYTKMGALNSLDIKIKDVDNEEDLIKSLNEFSGSIIIFDCHGNHGGEKSHAWLQIGDNKVDVWDLAKKARIPPIAILSACLTHPISGSHASVASGLMRCGAWSVIGTLIPIDSIKASVFIVRLLHRINEFVPAAIKYEGHISWFEVVSGFFKMSYVTDILLSMLEKDKLLSWEQYTTIHANANININTEKTNWFDLLLEDISKEIKMDADKVETLILNKYAFVETMAYVHLGNPENIVIDNN